MTTTSERRATGIVGDFLADRSEELVTESSRAPFFGLTGAEEEQVARDCREVVTGLRRAILADAAENPAAEGFSEPRALLAALTAQHGGDDLTAETAVKTSGLKGPLLRLWLADERSAEVATEGVVLLSAVVDTLRLVLLDTTLGSVREPLPHSASSSPSCPLRSSNCGTGCWPSR
ncbi:MAG TPA: hypothetical protein VJT49_02900 [Amycolatopsis sp.]|uniref:hypothetical protein n=1 Tax=Amycolatopsis sp. TaxID=37632 RepID=UPI002B45FDF4|nr:hypothetical protein [Amycolatopsis sp.]HKS44063.1 hypothetical protein [Amycolatopsis sp.]